MELEEIKRFVTTKQEQYKNILEIIEYHQNIINNIIKNNKLDNINDLIGRTHIFNSLLDLFREENIKYVTKEKLINYSELSKNKLLKEDEIKLYKGLTDEDIINSTNNGKEKAYIELLEYLNKKEN